MLYKERQVLQQQRQDAHGLWCTDLYRLSIANKVIKIITYDPYHKDCVFSVLIKYVQDASYQ